MLSNFTLVIFGFLSTVCSLPLSSIINQNQCKEV